jgi:trimeric autotransporter adhesin
VRSCSTSDCSDQEALTASGKGWKGTDNSQNTYFSELYNTPNNVLNGTIQTGSPSMNFPSFSGTGLSITNNRYFQYRAILESDDSGSGCNYGTGATWCSPELKSVNIGPNHYDTSAPNVISKNGINYYSLSGAIETLGSGCSAGVLYNLGYGASYSTAVWYYWNGTNWGIAGGTSSTANSAATLNGSGGAAFAQFGSQIGTGKVFLKAFLQSSGASPCQLKSIEFDGQY